jgi:hypothetical protein
LGSMSEFGKRHRHIDRLINLNTESKISPLAVDLVLKDRQYINAIRVPLVVG